MKVLPSSESVLCIKIIIMKKLLFIILTIIIISSCCKDEPLIPTLTHAPLKIGYSWVYQEYLVDSAGIETATNRFDSIVVTKDTVINDNKYFVLEGTNYPFISGWGIVNILRDSLGYMVDEKGNVHFAQYIKSDKYNSYELINSHQDSSGNTVNDTLYTSYDKMERYNNTISVPAGSFDNVLNFNHYVTLYKTITDGEKYFFSDNNLYVKGVGNVLRTYRFSSEAHIKRHEKRLLRYHLE